ncbi:MAG: hypothetical protein QM775_25655 [Pirellulales bacterium]
MIAPRFLTSDRRALAVMVAALLFAAGGFYAIAKAVDMFLG